MNKINTAMIALIMCILETCLIIFLLIMFNVEMGKIAIQQVYDALKAAGSLSDISIENFIQQYIVLLSIVLGFNIIRLIPFVQGYRLGNNKLIVVTMIIQIIYVVLSLLLGDVLSILYQTIILILLNIFRVKLKIKESDKITANEKTVIDIEV